MKFNKGQMYGLDVHIERKTQNHSNQEIDPARTHLNYELKPEYQKVSYIKAINQRLSDGYLGVKALRKDAVVACSFIVSSDSDFFANLTPEQERAYFQTAYDYIAKKYGEQNIISAKVHKDETTPHMHLVLVPLTKDGRLSAKELFDRQALLDLQAEIPKRLKAQGFKIERGTSSSKKHITTAEYKKMKIENQAANNKINPQDLTPKTLSKRFLLKDIENTEQIAERLSKLYLEPKNAEISELKTKIAVLENQKEKKSNIEQFAGEIAGELRKLGFSHQVNGIAKIRQMVSELNQAEQLRIEQEKKIIAKERERTLFERLANKLRVSVENIFKVLDFGKAPYKFEGQGEESYYVILENSQGKASDHWGIEYKKMLEDLKIERHDFVIESEGHLSKVGLSSPKVVKNQGMKI